MRSYIMIAIGGFFGAVLRFAVISTNFTAYAAKFPINTLMVNIMGSFAIGLIITISEELLKLKEAEKVGIIAGFLGAFTTFSTISREISQQLASGYFLLAGAYTISTIVFGLGAVFAGMYVGKNLLKLKQNED